MKIEHIALWTLDLERMRDFYERYFLAEAGPRYRNEKTGFESYFLSFQDGARLEIMQRPGIIRSASVPDGQKAELAPVAGYAHLALSVGDTEAVDELTARFRAEGVIILSPPRRTGDGYYESVIADPDGNHIELAAC